MPKKEAPLTVLQQYIPQDSFEDVLLFLNTYNIHLTITKRRHTVLGDYRHSTVYNAHRISINSNLNKYAFLITLLHEIAHLLVFEKFGNKVQAHGKEWKDEFGKILSKFIQKKIFPSDIEKALLYNVQNPKASSCADEDLMRVLYKYDKKKEAFCLLEQLSEHTVFKINGGRLFKKGNKIRKRYVCTEIPSGKVYLFSPVFEVCMVEAG